jgi:hypothetical protein
MGQAVNTGCNAYALFPRLYRLVERLHDKSPVEPYDVMALKRKLSRSQYAKLQLTQYDAKLLRRSVKEWHAITCPKKSCVPRRCPFREPTDWVEFRGFPDLFSVIQSIDPSKPIRFFPSAGGIDALQATWARREGHYNP